MAKAEFTMKFGGYSSGKSKATGKPFCSFTLLEIVENFGSEQVSLNRFFGDLVEDEIDKISDLELYDDVKVVLDVTASGKSSKLVSIKKII